MEHHGIPLLVVMAILFVSCEAYNSYVILIPKDTTPGNTFTIDITILKPPTSGTIRGTVRFFKEKSQLALFRDYQLAPATCAGGVCEPVSDVITVGIPADLKQNYLTVEITGETAERKFNETGTITVKQSVKTIFTQLDKAVYKASQTVKFRVVIADGRLKPYPVAVMILIEDPRGNRMREYIKDDKKALHFDEYSLSEDPILGDWTIKVTTSAEDDALEKTLKFEVSEYVLPKFEVIVTPPSFLITSDREASGIIKAQYTYGKPVIGSCTLRAYASMMITTVPPTAMDEETTLKLNDGKTDFTVPTPNLYSGLSYKFSATCTEDLTGNAITKNVTIQTYSSRFKLDFHGLTPKYYRKDLENTIIGKLSLADGSMLTPSDIMTTDDQTKDLKMDLFIERIQYYGYPYYNSQITQVANSTAEIGADGIAVFQVFMDKSWAQGNLQLKIQFRDGKRSFLQTKQIGEFHSTDGSLQLSMGGTNPGIIKAGQEAVFIIVTTFQSSTFYFLFYSRGTIVKTETVTKSAGKRHEYRPSLSDDIIQQMPPNVRVCVWIVTPGNKLLADCITVKVEGIFRHEVGVSISRKDSQQVAPEDILTFRPGEEVRVRAMAGETQSSIAVAFVDSAAALIGNYDEVSFTAAKAEKTLETTDRFSQCGGGYYPPYIGGGPPFMIDRRRRKKRSSVPYYGGYYGGCGGSNSKELLEAAAFWVKSDLEEEMYTTTTTTPIFLPGLPGGTQTTVPARTTTFAMTMTFPGTTVAGMPAPAPAATAPGAALPEDGDQAKQPDDAGFQEVERVRSQFPETWIFDVFDTEGSKDVNFDTTVPDSITDWIVSAFAVSEKNLDFTLEDLRVRAFKPFFISLDLPYSAVRGEELEVKIIIQSFDTQAAVNARVTLQSSDDFMVSGGKGKPYIKAKVEASVEVPSNGGIAVSVWVKLVKLGVISIEASAQTRDASDAVIRTVINKAEGLEQIATGNILLTHDYSNQASNKSFELQLPIDDLIPDSLRMSSAVVGDIMGPSMAQIGNLLSMPYGCGEQNMLNFAPNLFIMKYLSATGQDNPSLVAKAKKFTLAGYERELQYRRSDGLFSAFGERDAEGSTWLTAFVLKSFNEAQNWVDIPDMKRVIETSLNSLLMKQVTNVGNFREDGKVCHKAMQGGSASGMTLTAYVTITMLEVRATFPDEPMKSKLDAGIGLGLDYLVRRLNTVRDDPYALAILSYALTLHGHSEASNVFQSLKALATEEGGQMWWEEKQKPEPTPSTQLPRWRSPHHRASSVKVEIAAYALLTHVQLGLVSDALTIMKWLIEQRNPNGGFSSTQDTVMALQALGELGNEIYSSLAPDMMVTIFSNGDKFRFPQRITKDNKLLLQRIQLDDIPERAVNIFAIEAVGAGTALVQIIAKYNIKTVEDRTALVVNATSHQIRNGTIQVDVCASYLGGDVSGMVVYEVGALSGFRCGVQDKIPGVKRQEQRGDGVAFYLDEVDYNGKCVSVKQERYNLVGNLQPALASAYVYYNLDDANDAKYLPSELRGIDPCDTCAACCVDNDIELRFITDDGTTTGAMMARAVPMVTIVMTTLALIYNFPITL